MSSERDTSGPRWPDPRQFPRSIRLQFSVYIAVVILVLMAATAYFVTDRYVSTVTRGIAERLLFQARSYSGSAAKHLLSADGPDALMLSNICLRLSDESDDIYWAAIADAEHELVAHTDVRRVAAGGHLDGWVSAGGQELLRPGEAYGVSADTVRIRVPIRERDVQVGTLELAASAAPIAAAKQQSLMAIGSITLGVLLVGLPLTLLLTHRKLRPVSVIANYLRNARLEELDLNIPIETRNEFGYLAETLRVMGHRLNRAQSEMVERERMARELEIAREIQANMLPTQYPSAADSSFAGLYQSAREVGGDYFDFLDFDYRRRGFLVADVSGKSLPGMLVMLLTRDIVKHAARYTSHPADLLCQVNRELLTNIKRGMFVTMFFGVLDRETGCFEFASAGHNPLLHLRAEEGRIDQLRPNGFPLGLMPADQFDARLEVGSLHLKPGDVLVQYSDGINEAQNEAGEEFGMERLIDGLRKYGDKEPEHLVNALIADVQEFVESAAQYDDITMVAMKWMGTSTDKENEATNGNQSTLEHQSG